MTTTVLPAGASGEVIGRSGLPPGAVVAVDRYKYKYLIAIAVTLAAVLELIDTSIVNVAIPHMMGNLGATLDEISWVSTGYIIANVIVIPMSGWLSAYFGGSAISPARSCCSSPRRSSAAPRARWAG